MRRLLSDSYLMLALLLYSAGYAGVLFVHPSAMLFSALAFTITFVLGVIQHGFRSQPMRFRRYWKFAGPAFAVLLAATILLSLDRGAPANDNIPLLAQRQSYRFTRAPEVEPWRFFTVGVSFVSAWHLLGIGFTAEQWASLRRPKPRRSPSLR